MIFRRLLGRGKACSIVSIIGPSVASGQGCWSRCSRTATTSGTPSTAPSIEPTNTQRVEKGGPTPGDWPLAGRSVDQSPPRRRCPWTPDCLRAHGRSTARRNCRTGLGKACPIQATSRRQGLRLRRLSSGVRGTELRPCDSLQSGSVAEIPYRSGPVQSSRGSRVHLQPAQAGPSIRHPLREDAP